MEDVVFQSARTIGRLKSANKPLSPRKYFADLDNKTGSRAIAPSHPAARNRLPSHQSRRTQFPPAHSPRKPSDLQRPPQRFAGYPTANFVPLRSAHWGTGAQSEYSARRAPIAKVTRGSSVPRDRSQPMLFYLPAAASPFYSRQRRNASVNPPSTGITCPVVQRDCGPARNKIAAAQSCGSIGW